MILLDPDLDPALAPTPMAAKKTSASVFFRDHRLPSTRTLARFLAMAQTAARMRGQVTVLLTTGAALRKLNRQFRGINKATDVLSFPAIPVPGFKGAEAFAGDLAISVPTALDQAREQGHSLSTEIKVLILHGLLHLGGYDHEADNGQMIRREGQLRARLGLPLGLIERAGQPKPSVRPSAAKAPKAAVLKGHGFSRAVKSPKKIEALAAEGRSFAGKTIPVGLKPDVLVASVAARLKSSPFEAGKNGVRGIPPLRQKQKRRKDGAPSIAGAPDKKRSRRP